MGEDVRSFEEAVALVGVGRFHWVLVFVIGASMLAAIGEGLNMAFVLPVARCDLDIRTAEQGLINAVGFIGIMLTSHFWGFMSDTWGRQKVLRVSLGTGFVSCVISSLSYNSTMMLITRLAVGMTLSGVQASGISYLGEFHCDANRALYVTLAVVGMVLSIIYQSLMGLVILPMTWRFEVIGLAYTPWRLFLLMNSSIIAVAFGTMLTLPESPKFELVMGRPDEALRILQMVYAKNTGKPIETYPVKAIKVEETVGSDLSSVNGVGPVLRLIWNQTWPLFYPPYLRSILMIFYISFSSFFVAHGFYLWLPQILDIYALNQNETITTCDAMHDGHYSSTRSALTISAETECVVSPPLPMIYITTSIFGAGFLIMYLSILLLMKRYGKLWLMFGWFCTIATSCVILQWTNQFYLNMALFLLLNSSAPCSTLISAVAADFYPTQYKSMALCLIFLISRVGSITGSNAVGAMLFNHCPWWLGLDAGFMYSSAVVYYFLMRSPKSRPVDDKQEMEAPHNQLEAITIKSRKAVT